MNQIVSNLSKQDQVIAACEQVLAAQIETKKFVEQKKVFDCVVNAVSAYYNLDASKLLLTNVRGEYSKPRSIVYLLLWRLKDYIHHPTFSVYKIADFFDLYASNVTTQKNNLIRKISHVPSLEKEVMLIEKSIFQVIKKYQNV